MPLAGSLKLRTFLLLIGGAVVLVLGAAGAGFFGWVIPALEAQQHRMAELRGDEGVLADDIAALESARAAKSSKVEVRKGPSAQGLVEVPPATATDLPTGRPVDAVVVRYLGQPLGSPKRKDVTSGKPYKVNVYQDDGEPVANRAKVDLDRDDRWDEKWTWDAGVISRQTAPGDDEVYTVTEVWQQGAWAKR
jgi:hypothetical protein